MRDAPILVIGGGPAGMSAAAVLAAHGQHVLLIEQRDQLGGAIHRQPATAEAAAVLRTARHERSFSRLMAAIDAQGERIERMTSTVFLGVDGDGSWLLDRRDRQVVTAIRPRAAILALGAVERAVPFLGWDLPGVMTAGGAQVLLKESGVTPPGPILVAGSGPLLLAVAAQLTAAGAAPVAVLERGQPRQQMAAAMAAARSLPHLSEALGYASRLALARVPYRTGRHVTEARRTDDGLVVRTADASGAAHDYRVGTLIVHDGLRPNDAGLGPLGDFDLPVEIAGDGREVLGADAAVLDGRRAARAVAARLGLAVDGPDPSAGLAAARGLQAALGRLWQHATPRPDPATVICRCEGRTAGDLAALPASSAPREIRLVGRFGMGACQGRFCAEHALALSEGAHRLAGIQSLAGSSGRWPLRPVSLAALARLDDFPSDA